MWGVRSLKLGDGNMKSVSAKAMSANDNEPAVCQLPALQEHAFQISEYIQND